MRPESALLLRAPTAAPPAGEAEEEEEVENIIFSLSLYLCSNASFDRYTRGEMTRFFVSYFSPFLRLEREIQKRERDTERQRERERGSYLLKPLVLVHRVAAERGTTMKLFHLAQWAAMTDVVRHGMYLLPLSPKLTAARRTDARPAGQDSFRSLNV